MPRCRVDAGHVVDHVGHGHLVEHLRVGRKVLRVEMQHDVPIELGDAIDDAPKLTDLGRATEVRDEIEPRAAHADVVQLTDLGVREALVDHRDSRVAPVAAHYRIDHRGIVRAVTTRLYEHGTRKAESFLQTLKVLDAGIGRGVGPIVGEREPCRGAEDVTMRVTGARGWGKRSWSMRVWVWWRDRPLEFGGHRRALSIRAGIRCRRTVCAWCG